MVYMNTNVTRGAGEFVVTATGMATEVGHISGLLAAEEAGKSPLTRQLDRLTNQILWIAGAALVVSVVLNLARGDTFTAVFTAAIAFAVGALPENLPAVVTTILAYGTQALARAGAIMKRMQSTETLGSTSAINSDKTGTLTLNQMTAVAMAVVGRRYSIEGTGYSTDGQIARVAGQTEIPLDQFLMPMVLASDAVLSDGEMIGDPTEGALVALAAKGGVDAASTRQAYPRIAELPFDAAYKLMATFHQMTDESGTPVVRCFVKGAPDQLLARAATVFDADAAGRCRPTASSAALPGREPAARRAGPAGAGHRPQGPRPGHLRPRRRPAPAGERPGDARTRRDRRPAAPHRQGIHRDGQGRPGIRVRMITGDHAVTAAAIAGQLGIDGKVITGAEFGSMSDEEALSAIDGVGVIARVTPEHKVRLVDMLKKRGQIVAMTGDGVNDAPGAEEGRHRDRDGHHRDRGDQGSRGDDPHRRRLLDDRQGGGTRPRALRQPRQVHPVPDGLPVRLHRLLPRRQHLQHRRRRAVPAAADAVDQLHHPAVPGHRPWLRPTRRRPDGPQATPARPAHPAPRDSCSGSSSSG